MTDITPFDSSGPADALPIIFIHGATATRKMWQPQMKDLGKEFRVMALDLPGHGVLREKSFSLDAAVQEVVNVIDVAGPALLVGLSLGGYVAMLCAQRYAVNVKGLVLSGCSIDYPLWASLLARINSQILIGVYGERAFVSMLETGFSWMFPQATMSQVSAGFHPQAWGDAVLEIGRRDFLAGLQTFPGPVLILNGAYDTLNRTCEDAFAAAPQHGRLQIIESAGHMCNLDQPATFNQLVRDFAHSLER